VEIHHHDVFPREDVRLAEIGGLRGTQQALPPAQIPQGDAIHGRLRIIQDQAHEGDAIIMARDEGHGFRRKTNRDYYDQATALFLERYLL
jgi:hypothetical protein